MNIQVASFQYITHILNAAPGPKVILYDDESLPVISMSITKTELLTMEVGMTQNFREVVNGVQSPELQSMQAVCFLRPTDENVNLICSELSHPHFMRYVLIFTNIVSEAFLRQIAGRDTKCLVNSIQEAFIDVLPAGPSVYSIGIPDIKDIRPNPFPTSSKITRIVDGIFSNLCSLKIRPQIRYDKSSVICKTIATSVSKQIDDFVDIFSPQPSPHLLLIIDRLSDPITPLLHHWYYEEAIHDLFTIINNTADINGDVHVLDQRTDEIFAEYATMYVGDVFQNVASKMDHIKAISAKIRERGEIADFHEKIAAVSKGQEEKVRVTAHIGVCDAIQSRVGARKMQLTGLEQETATAPSAADVLEPVLQQIASPEITDLDALRLALVFVIHFESNVQELDNALAARGLSSSQREILGLALERAGSRTRAEDIFSSKKSFLKRRASVADEPESEYDLFRCLVGRLVSRVSNMALSEDDYPFVARNQMCGLRPQKVVVFVAGGCTYEEVRYARKMSTKDFEVIIGGTTIHNAQSFIENELSK